MLIHVHWLGKTSIFTYFKMIYPSIWQLRTRLTPKYDLQCIFCIFYIPTHPKHYIHEVTILQTHYWHQNWRFYNFDPRFLKLVTFCTIKTSSPLNMAYKVYDAYCFVYPPTQTIHWWSYSTSNAKLGSKLMIIVFYAIMIPVKGL